VILNTPIGVALQVLNPHHWGDVFFMPIMTGWKNLPSSLTTISTSTSLMLKHARTTTFECYQNITRTLFFDIL